MSNWTLVGRRAEKPPERGLVSFDLTIDDGDPHTLSFVEAEDLEVALGNALTGIGDVVVRTDAAIDEKRLSQVIRAVRASR